MPHRKHPRNTRQREIILEELQKVASHPTAVELYEMVRRRLPKVSLGTVYRNLELLNEKGAIQKLALYGSEARFDGNTDRHYHVRCVRCCRVDDLHGLPDNLLKEEPKEVSGYEILGHHLEFVGVCPVCIRKRTKTDGQPADDTEEQA